MSRRKKSLFLAAAVLVLAITAALVGGLLRSRQSNQDIELSEPFGNIQNGTAYDRAVIDLRGATTVILPAGHPKAVVRKPDYVLGVYRIQESPDPEHIEILVKITLAFAGHIRERMDIREVRKQYRVWEKRHDASLIVAIDPGWDSAIEGGVVVEVSPRVPAGVTTVQKPYEDDAYQGWFQADKDRAMAAGWHLVPQQPLPKEQFR